MKAMKKALALGLALAMVVTAVPVTSAQAASTAKLSASKVSVAAGTAKKQTKSIKVTTPSTWKSVKVKASSSDKKIATVKVSGKTVKVTAVKKGSAKVTVKVSAKKSGKTVKKTLTAKVKVVNAGLRFVNPATEVVVGESVTLTAKKCPKAAVVTFKSSDDTIATVDADGKVTGVKAGKVTITATSDYGKEVTTEVTVKDAVAVLSTVKQTASNAFTAEFTADASKTITKDDIKVVAADGSSELAVKSVEYSEDGKSAVVTLFGNFTNTTVYNVTCKEAKVELTAKVGAVARVYVSTTSAEQNVETPIKFTLFDAEGIDVTPSVSVDTTCIVTITGDYSAANLDKASKASLTMNTLGAKADVTVTYNSNVSGATDVSGTATVICTDTAVTQGTKLYATKTIAPGNDVNFKSGSAKFYLGLSDEKVSLPVNTSLLASGKTVYFCAKDAKGDVISYDTYEAESSNDDVASVAVLAGSDSGKYAQIDVTGNSVGSAQINIKATKNGKSTYYTIPVFVTTVAEATTMEVSIDRPTMSDVQDHAYFGQIKAQLYDKDHNKVAGNYTFECKTASDAPIIVNPVTGKVTAYGADEKTYTIEVVGADNNNNTKTFTKRITVTVKKLPADKSNLNLVYQIELNRTAIDENPSNRNDDSVTAKLYATYNGLFAGYVRGKRTDSNVTIAEGTVTGSAVTMISNVTVSAKFGTKTFGTTNGFVSEGSAASLGTENVGDTFTAVSSNNVTYDVANKTSTQLAKTGLYTIEYSYTQNGKSSSKTRTVTVNNSVFIPTVTVSTRKVDNISNNNDIIAALKTNVDMNNNTSAYNSISNPVNASVTATKRTIKSVDVVDNYASGDWTFVVPVNATFTAE